MEARQSAMARTASRAAMRSADRSVSATKVSVPLVQPALGSVGEPGMNVDIAADAGGPALGAPAPVGEEAVAEKKGTRSVAQSGLMAGRRLPDAEIVAEKGPALGNPEKLARDEAVLLVHAGEDLSVD